MTPNAPLELSHVSKSFNGKPAVKDLSLSVKQGEILGFLGPNGAGKSTSLRMALGVLPPDNGDVRLFGSTPSIKSLRRVGFLPEERGLYRKMSARAIIAFFARLKGMKGSDALSRADELLERHGLGDSRKSRISRLSKGMAQKVQILSALAHRPDLIILDEPFSGLDPVNQQDLETLILREHERGATIIFSTHVMEHAERLCDRLVIIGKGEKRFEGNLDEALGLLPEQAVLTTSKGFNLQAVLEPAGFRATKLLPANDAQDWAIDLKAQQTAQDALRAAIEKGAPIVAFSPGKAKLRDVFVSLVGEDTPGEAQSS